MASDEGNGDRRYRRTLEGVLQLAIDNTPSDTTQQQQQPNTTGTSPQNQAWLSAALANIAGGGTDLIERLKDDLTTLNKPDDGGSDEIDHKIMALEDLTDLCENMDIANDFHKIGGYNLLPHLLRHSNPEVRLNTAELVASLTQNNIYCQKAALETDLLDQLIKMVDSDPVADVKVKAIFAVSSITRNCPEAQTMFLSLDGFEMITKALQSDVHKLQMKAAFFMRALCSEDVKFKDILWKIGMAELLVGLLLKEHNEIHEHLMGALLNMVDGHSGLITECRRPEFQLKTFLEQRISQLSGKEECLEEVEYANSLHKICFSSSSDPYSESER